MLARFVRHLFGPLRREVNSSTDTEMGLTLQGLLDSVNRLEKSIELISKKKEVLEIARHLKPNNLSSLDLIKFNYENSVVQINQNQRNNSCNWIEHECLSGARTTELGLKETKFFKGQIKLN